MPPPIVAPFADLIIHLLHLQIATGLIPAIRLVQYFPASLDPTRTPSNLGRWLDDFPNQALSARHHLPLSCPTSSSKRNASLHRPYRHGFPVYIHRVHSQDGQATEANANSSSISLDRRSGNCAPLSEVGIMKIFSQPRNSPRCPITS